MNLNGRVLSVGYTIIVTILKNIDPSRESVLIKGDCKEKISIRVSYQHLFVLVVNDH